MKSLHTKNLKINDIRGNSLVWHKWTSSFVVFQSIYESTYRGYRAPIYNEERNVRADAMTFGIINFCNAESVPVRTTMITQSVLCLQHYFTRVQFRWDGTEIKTMLDAMSHCWSHRWNIFTWKSPHNFGVAEHVITSNTKHDSPINYGNALPDCVLFFTRTAYFLTARFRTRTMHNCKPVETHRM